MVDDLVSRGITEPYRMFTSRAEYRLALRADNADQRLTAKGVELGCVGAERRDLYQAKAKALSEAREYARSVSVSPSEAERHGFSLKKDGHRRTAFELLSYPDIGILDVARIWPRLGALSQVVAGQLEIDAKYDVYLSRQAADIDAYRRDEALLLPEHLDYAAITGLSNEARHKLTTHRPRSIGHAAKLEGMTPAALTLVVAHLRRGGLRAASPG
jgi:tRNA uridine 5-carboxymethylaminomethyl modification enzyme